MEGKIFKEQSEAAIKKKEELQAMKSNLLRGTLYVYNNADRGDVSSSEVRSEEADFSSREVLR